MSKKKKTKRKLSKKKVFTFFLIVFVISFIINLFNTNITNIYISGNKYLTDQQIIDLAKLSNYPSSINNLSYKVSKRLEENIYIDKASVSKNLLLNKIYIKINENYPLFYYKTKDKTILYNGNEIDKSVTHLTVINSIPDDVYNSFILKLKKLNIDSLNRISEIEYKPNEIYKDRFILFMNDGNYVYITLDNFITINKYLDIIKYFDTDKKGIIKLDSGKYFEAFDN